MFVETKLLLHFAAGLESIMATSLKARLAGGSLLFILGFVGYQVGVHLLPGGSQTLRGYLAPFMPKGSVPTETLGLALQFSGGIVAIVGLAVCLSALAQPVFITQEAESAPPPPASAPVTALKIRCPFCGEPMDEGTIFCPACGRSQR
jgi:hypothetical protein